MFDTEFHWGMFTDRGNRAVQDIYDRCLELAQELTDHEVWRYAYSRLAQLSYNDSTSEATEPAVVDTLGQALVDAYAIRITMPALDYNSRDEFDSIVSTYDVQHEFEY